MKQTVLVFCAHSDDQVLGPGGTIAKYAAEGKRVHNYIFSYGEQSHPWLKQHITAKMREKEAQEADGIIGSQTTFFGLREGHFGKDAQERKLAEQIAAIVKKAGPEKIFIHSRQDTHPDHRAVYDIITQALNGYKGEVYAFTVWGPWRLFQKSAPHLYVDISTTFATKRKALECFRSQWMARTILTWSVWLKAWWAGTHAGCRFAESFERVR